MKNFSKFNFKKYHLFIVLILALIFRLYGLNWDQNQHLHPDERFLTMVTQAVKLPSVDPYEAGYDFFVYGTLPLTIVKIVSSFVIIDKLDYNNITLVGRIVSTFFDLGVVFLIYKISENIFDKKIGLLAAFFYSISVLPIQLSHFYAVDTFLNFFIVLSFYILVSLIISKQLANSLVLNTLLGIALGLSLASKISSVLFIPVIFLGLLFKSLKEKKLLFSAYCLVPIVFFAYFSLRFVDPHVFTNQFVENLKQLKSFDNPNGYFPPAIQWIKIKPIIFPLKNMVLWGLGLPLGILAILGVFNLAIVLIREFRQSNNLTVRQLSSLLILFWILFLFFYQGVQFSKAMRYFLPIYPFLAIIAANFFQSIVKSKLFRVVCYVLFLIYPLSFLAIYSRPHSRVTASDWIYKNIPPGSTLSCEHWDDCLPLSLEQKNHTLYNIETLALYDPDTPQKWQKINSQLENIDYLVMSSNRLWGSIPIVPEKYPIASKFYKDLFDEKLDFKKVAEITSYPTIPVLNISIPDDLADETFTVYDHPKVLIYKKV